MADEFGWLKQVVQNQHIEINSMEGGHSIVSSGDPSAQNRFEQDLVHRKSSFGVKG